MQDDVRQRIDALVQSNEVVLFMKGDLNFPMCGFSGRAVQILKACGLDAPRVVAVNVLADEEIRQAMKEYSQWPTFPQLYVRGEFIGGADIMTQMYEAGEMQAIVLTPGGKIPVKRSSSVDFSGCSSASPVIFSLAYVV